MNTIRNVLSYTEIYEISLLHFCNFVAYPKGEWASSPLLVVLIHHLSQLYIWRAPLVMLLTEKYEFFPCKKVGKLILLRNSIILLSSYQPHWACNALCEYVDNKIRKSHWLWFRACFLVFSAHKLPCRNENAKVYHISKYILNQHSGYNLL